MEGAVRKCSELTYKEGWQKYCHAIFVLSRATILVELEMDGNTEPLNFVPGDHVGIFPGNSPELVAGILKHLPNAPPINQSLRLEFLSAYPGTEHLTVPNYIMEVLHKIA